MRIIKKMEGLLRKELSVTMLKSIGHSAGCISDGRSYEIDSGKIFVKHNVDKKVGVVITTLIRILRSFFYCV